MLKRTPPEVLQEQEQETGFRRVMRTFDPEVPGYVFWPIIFGVGVIFSNWCSAASSGARRLWIEALEFGARTASGGVGYQKHCLRLCIRCLATASPFKAMDRRTALPDSRMSTFLEFQGLPRPCCTIGRVPLVDATE